MSYGSSVLDFERPCCKIKSRSIHRQDVKDALHIPEHFNDKNEWVECKYVHHLIQS